MKFKKIEIQNYKSIEKLVLNEIEDVVIIVGGNGVGKSSIFDALRLLKSSYGGYQANEWSHWFNEFGLKNTKGEMDISTILRNKSEPFYISANIELSKSEIEYIKLNKKQIIQRLLWNGSYKNSNDPLMIELPTTFSNLDSSKLEKLNKQTKKNVELLEIELEKQSLYAEFKFYENESYPRIKENILLEVIFSTYDLENIGVIDYNSANRSYRNDSHMNFNINFDPVNINEQYSLYNTENKYNNIKSELTSSYVKALISKESGEGYDDLSFLNDSLKELFNTFFPNKQFLGIKPTKNGQLEFNVKTESGQIHDINALSSGEKELLFGYLRLYNKKLRNSLILIDEPELHLNPKLVKKLPEFYSKYLGEKFNNQIWLITHSDTIIKESLGLGGVSIFHMTHPEAIKKGENQVNVVSNRKDVELSLIDLVGDFSSYHKGKNVVIFEGENSEFDRDMVVSLFPEFESKINTISAGSKTKVKNVQSILNMAVKEGIIDKVFISITDKDSDFNEIKEHIYNWDVYHIENYLLDEKIILEVIKDLKKDVEDIKSEDKIYNELKKIAESTKEFHLSHRLRSYVSSELKKCLITKTDGESIYSGLYDSSLMSIENIKKKTSNILSKNSLEQKYIKIQKKLDNSLECEEWKKIFRGRDILKKFSNIFLAGTNYYAFRNLIISKMKNQNFQPIGMKKIIDKILKL